MKYPLLLSVNAVAFGAERRKVNEHAPMKTRKAQVFVLGFVPVRPRDEIPEHAVHGELIVRLLAVATRQPGRTVEVPSKGSHHRLDFHVRGCSGSLTGLDTSSALGLLPASPSFYRGLRSAIAASGLALGFCAVACTSFRAAESRQEYSPLP